MNQTKSAVFWNVNDPARRLNNIFQPKSSQEVIVHLFPGRDTKQRRFAFNFNQLSNQCQAIKKQWIFLIGTFPLVAFNFWFSIFPIHCFAQARELMLSMKRQLMVLLLSKQFVCFKNQIDFHDQTVVSLLELFLICDQLKVVS